MSLLLALVSAPLGSDAELRIITLEELEEIEASGEDVIWISIDAAATPATDAELIASAGNETEDEDGADDVLWETIDAPAQATDAELLASMDADAEDDQSLDEVIALSPDDAEVTNTVSFDDAQDDEPELFADSAVEESGAELVACLYTDDLDEDIAWGVEHNVTEEILLDAFTDADAPIDEDVPFERPLTFDAPVTPTDAELIAAPDIDEQEELQNLFDMIDGPLTPAQIAAVKRLRTLMGVGQ